jgi:Helix-turn-helix domain
MTTLHGPEDVARVVHQLRKARMWICLRLGEEIGHSHAYVSLIERGFRVPHTPKLILLLDALDADLVVVKRP